MSPAPFSVYIGAGRWRLENGLPGFRGKDPPWREEFADFNAERDGDLYQVQGSDIPFPPLDPAIVGPIPPARGGKNPS